METRSVDGITLWFDAEERDAATLIGDACAKTAGLLNELWGLETPNNCRVYVMTSWLRFVLHSASWPRRVYLTLMLPLVALQVGRVWKYAGGWNLPLKEGPAVGVKPPSLIQQADRSAGDQLFIREADIREKVEHLTCHELTHAFTCHLALPSWLNEGLAMVAVDRYFGRPTVRPETLEILSRASDETGAGAPDKLPKGDPEALVELYIRAYWVTRYIQETQPVLLRAILSECYDLHVLEAKLAGAYDIEPREFWTEMNRLVTSHYVQEEGKQG
jgi:hypothetical protein